MLANTNEQERQSKGLTLFLFLERLASSLYNKVYKHCKANEALFCALIGCCDSYSKNSLAILYPRNSFKVVVTAVSRCLGAREKRILLHLR